MKTQLQNFIFLSLILILNPAFAQNAGDLFTDFGVNGKVNTNIGQASFIVKSQTVQSDGKIIMVGDIDDIPARNCFILRLNSDGSLDTSFNLTGKIIYNEMRTVNKVLIQNDGKIVVGGRRSGKVVLMRYNSDGTVDTTFGINGVAENLQSSGSPSLKDFAIQTDGKFLIIADNFTSSQGFNYDCRLFRFNSNGSSDITFGTDGSVTNDLGGLEISKSIALQSDGKFFVGGSSSSINGFSFIYVLKYNSNGTLDTTFNSTGIKTFNNTNQTILFNLELQTDEKIVFAYPSNSSSGPKINLVRLNSNSTMDTTFGTNGIVTFNGAIASGRHSNKFRIQSDGKFFILYTTAEIVDNFLNYDISMMRVNANGTIDTTFNGSGTQEFSFFENDNIGSDFSIIGNQILISGNTAETLTLNKIALAKFNLDGSLDDNFDGDGKAFYSFPVEAYDESYSSTIQVDGKVIVAGTSYINGNRVLSASRYNTDGSIDSSFGESGFFKLNTLYFDSINSIKTDSNGKILLGLESGATVIRLNNNGTLDETFGNSGFGFIFTPDFSFLRDMKVLDDNSILAVGTLVNGINSQFSNNFLLAKLDPNGILVPTFGTNGISTLSSTSLADYLHVVDTQADGKIISAGIGNVMNNGVSDIMIFRTDSNGTLDPTFNTTGILNLQNTTLRNKLVGLQIQSDGKILLANNYNTVLNTINTTNTMLFRINTDGTIDTSFGTAGYIYFNTNLLKEIGSVKLLSNQQIMVAGTKENTTSDWVLMKLNANGTLDTTFGTNGIATTDFYNEKDKALGLLIANDDNLIVTGTTFSPTGSQDFAVAKYYLNTQLGIGKNVIDKKILFYPNPVNNILYLSPEVENATLFTLDGKQINSILVNNSIATDSLPKGVYIIQMKLVNGKVISNKLIKE